MKKITIVFTFFIGIILLLSCESQENKNSRIAIDKYARKLNSMMIDVVESREEEGSQSRLTINRFYDRYNDLDFEEITEKYKPYRDDLVSVSRTIDYYLNVRKDAIINMTDALSSYKSANRYSKDYDEYIEKARTSHYSSDHYFDMARNYSMKKLEESLEFIYSKADYQINILQMDSLYFRVDSISSQYNQLILDKKLTEGIKLPDSFYDTTNDFIYSSKKFLLELEID